MSNQNLKNIKLNREFNGRFQKGTNYSPDTEFKKGTHWRLPQVFRSKEYLIIEYIEKGRSSKEIAQEHSVTDSAILFWLKKHNIQRRTIIEAREKKKWGLSGKQNGMYGRCGSQNPRWIDGSSPERQALYARSFWKELQKAVYARDAYKCSRCESPHTGKNKLHAHHVKPWAGNIDTRFDMANIITLCQKCHNWVHSKENLNNEYLST